MKVAIFVLDVVADFGLAALRETFSVANSLWDRFDQPLSKWDIRLISFRDSVRSEHGNLIPTTPLSELSDAAGTLSDIDLVIMPAVNITLEKPLLELVSGEENKPVLTWLRQTHEGGIHIAAACTATFFLAESGILDGNRATTSWWLGPAFRQRYPAVDLDEKLTLCRTETVTTAGASLAHMDLALSLVHAASPVLAELTARYLVIGSDRGQVNYIVPSVMAQRNSTVADFERWVRENLGQQFQIADVARHIGVTERTLQRAVHAELGMTPRDFVNDIRLDRATQLLRTTDLTVETIAGKVGYLNPGTLRGLIKRRRNTTITQLRSSPLTW